MIRPEKVRVTCVPFSDFDSAARWRLRVGRSSAGAPRDRVGKTACAAAGTVGRLVQPALSGIFVLLNEKLP
jgi:hypothetical protein